MKKIIKKLWSQKTINVIVIILAAVSIGEFLYWNVSIGGWDDYDYYETLPDDVKVLDDKIEVLLEDVPSTPEKFDSDFYNPDIDIVFNDSIPDVELEAGDVYSKSLESVVYINTANDFGLYSLGSGSVIGSNGIILTNYHVIELAEKIAITLSNKETYPVTDVVLIDIEKDIAVLKIDAEVPAMPFADSDSVEVGDTVYAIGHPENLLFTLSQGIVSGIREYNKTGEGKQIQMTNPISEGSSGGALLNEKGQLIGVPTSSIEYDSNLSQVQNINFAIPVNNILNLLKIE